MGGAHLSVFGKLSLRQIEASGRGRRPGREGEGVGHALLRTRHTKALGWQWARHVSAAARRPSGRCYMAGEGLGWGWSEQALWGLPGHCGGLNTCSLSETGSHWRLFEPRVAVAAVLRIG